MTRRVKHLSDHHVTAVPHRNPADILLSATLIVSRVGRGSVSRSADSQSTDKDTKTHSVRMQYNVYYILYKLICIYIYIYIILYVISDPPDIFAQEDDAVEESEKAQPTHRRSRQRV